MIKIGGTIIGLALLCFWAVAPQTHQETREVIVSVSAEEYIAAFRRGEEFTPPSKGVFFQGKPDPKAVEVLRHELGVASSDVRKQIVRLLVDMATSTDALKPQGGLVLREPQILGALMNEGLSKADAAREIVMERARSLATPSALAPFAEQITKALDERATTEAFLLVAKAKPPKAAAMVEGLGQMDQWKTVLAARVARAALGNTTIENEFLQVERNAKDGESLAKAISQLGLIGTPAALRAIAMQLRTPLTIDRPTAYEKSVRLDVLDALHYTYREALVLNSNSIQSDKDYEAAEEFCAKTLGVSYLSPRPPFLTYRGYPRPRLEQN